MIVYALVALLGVFSALEAAAQPASEAAAQPASVAVHTLSISDAVSYAQDHNISLARSKISLDAARRTKNTSWNSISPSGSVSGTVSAPDDSLSDYTASLTGTVSVSFSPNLFTTIKNASLSYEQGKITWQEACRTVELNIRKSYYALLYELENLELQKRNLETAKQQWQNNKAKYEQGRMSELDVLSAEVKYKNLLPTVQSAEVTYKNDLASFRQLLGLPADEAIVLTGSLDDILQVGDISLDVEHLSSPDLEKLQVQLKSARTTVTAKRFSAYAPSLSARWQHGLIPSSGEHISASSQLDQSGTVSVTASIPLDGILPWSSYAVAIDTAKDTVADLQLQIQNEQTSLRVEAESALRTISQSRSAILSKQASIELAARTLDMTEQAYNRGTKDLLSLQNASDSLLSAEVSLKSEQRTLINAVLSLEYTLGVPFGSLGLSDAASSTTTNAE
ncbi:MAG: TolC family protein [Treponema sp.]|nr:TolC family protein [Treponema sp.]